MKYHIILFFLLLGMLTPGLSQESLSLDEAIRLALENNYGILVAQNNAQISANNAHPGAAGLLPTIAGTAGGNYNVNNTKFEFAEVGPSAIPAIDEGGVPSSSINAGINLNYTVFDGLGNVNTFRVLKKSAELSQTQLQAAIEATINLVGAAYYAIARLEESYATLGESIQISKDRLERAKTQQEFGSANKLAIINAEVDLNTDSANRAVTYVNLDNAKRNLNALIGREINADFEVSTEVSFDRDMELADLINTARTNNSDLQLAAYNQEIAELNLKVAKAGYMPVVGLTTGYNFNRSDNGAGFILSQQNLGFSVGASLNIPIFAGNQRKVAVQNAQIGLLTSQYQQKDAQQSLQRDLSNAYYTYQSSLNQLDLEQKSLELAQENFSRTESAFRLGQATNVQFREAQRNLQLVKDRINDLRFTAKLNELELLRLSGQLVEA